MRNVFPLPRERLEAPRHDGRYSGVDVEAELRFSADGALTWDAAAGEWTMYGTVLRVTVGERQCEGAIGPDAIYLECAGAGGRQDRSQIVASFIADT